MSRDEFETFHREINIDRAQANTKKIFLTDD